MNIDTITISYLIREMYVFQHFLVKHERKTIQQIEKILFTQKTEPAFVPTQKPTGTLIKLLAYTRELSNAWPKSQSHCRKRTSFN